MAQVVVGEGLIALMDGWMDRFVPSSVTHVLPETHPLPEDGFKLVSCLSFCSERSFFDLLRLSRSQRIPIPRAT